MFFHLFIAILYAKISSVYKAFFGKSKKYTEFPLFLLASLSCVLCTFLLICHYNAHIFKSKFQRLFNSLLNMLRILGSIYKQKIRQTELRGEELQGDIIVIFELANFPLEVLF